MRYLYVGSITPESPGSWYRLFETHVSDGTRTIEPTKAISWDEITAIANRRTAKDAVVQRLGGDALAESAVCEALLVRECAWKVYRALQDAEEAYNSGMIVDAIEAARKAAQVERLYAADCPASTALIKEMTQPDDPVPVDNPRPGLAQTGFATLTDAEARYITDHVMHCGCVRGGDMWPFDPDLAAWTDVLPQYAHVRERLQALEMCHRLIYQLREHGQPEPSLLDSLRRIFAEACCGVDD